MSPPSTSGSVPITNFFDWPRRNFVGSRDRGRIDESLGVLAHDWALVAFAAVYHFRISAPFICTTPLRLLMSA
jgi:hypothetical protein